jgi:hypothetical protein
MTFASSVWKCKPVAVSIYRTLLIPFHYLFSLHHRPFKDTNIIKSFYLQMTRGQLLKSLTRIERHVSYSGSTSTMDLHLLLHPL